MPKPGKNYLLNTEEKQEWMRDYFFAPRGLGFLEPGIVGPDDARVAAFNVAKSFYQTRPDVFNLALVAEKTGLSADEIKARLQRMYDERLYMLVKNSSVGVYGFGLWYWVVKTKDGCPPEEKQKLTDWIQNNNEICTGYACDGGDFDFYCGNHMRVLDNLLEAIIDPIKQNPYVEYVHLCPVRRDLRESSVNQADTPFRFREFRFSDEAKKKLFEYTDKIDEKDLEVLEVLNNTEFSADLFNYDVLQELSGLDGAKMREDFSHVMDESRFLINMLYLNFMKLGLNNHCYLIRMFQNTPSYRKSQIIDELAANPDFNNVFEFTDSYHDAIFMAYEELTDSQKLRETMEAYPEIEEILEANSPRQFRRWTARLDDDTDNWEMCVFTDDLLQNRMARKNACSLCADKEENESC